MKKLFVHHPLFRLLSPLFSGILVYLLILLVNNNVEQLNEQFLSDELYFCIGLSFIIQELSRLLLVVFQRSGQNKGRLFLVTQVIASLLVCIGVVTLAIQLYYRNVLGFEPNSEELWLFNIIFSVVTLIYILLSVSYQYLYKVNTERLNEEMVRKQLLEEDFIAFKNEINPDLLFDSLETIISTLDDKDRVDELIDQLASTYRYVLSKNRRQLVLIDEEIQVLEQFSQLINNLPYTKIDLKNSITSDFLIVPGSLLKIVELIVRGSIIDDKAPMVINLKEHNGGIVISYNSKDKIIDALTIEDLGDIDRIYKIYSTEAISLNTNAQVREVHIPKLHVNL